MIYCLKCFKSFNSSKGFRRPPYRASSPFGDKGTTFFSYYQIFCAFFCFYCIFLQKPFFTFIALNRKFLAFTPILLHLTHNRVRAYARNLKLTLFRNIFLIFCTNYLHISTKITTFVRDNN